MYQIPTDLPLLPITWATWSLADRMTVARTIHVPKATTLHRQSAVAISMHEQPGKIPVGNCCGLMCQGRNHPWGWSCGWTIRPIGYALIREGLTGKAAPFLAFVNPADSLLFLLERVVSRNLTSGQKYAAHWFGGVAGTPSFSKAVSGFETWLRRVKAAWPTKPRSDFCDFRT